MPIDEVARDLSDPGPEDGIHSDATSAGTSDPLDETLRPRTAQTHSVVVHDAYAAEAFAQTLEVSPRLKRAVLEATQRLATAAALIEDVFYSVYQPSPVLRPPEELPLGALVNRAIVEQLVATSEWDALRRAGTIGDQLCSAIATTTVCRSVLAALDRATLERLGELSAAEKAADKLFEEAEALDDVAAQKGDRAADLHARAQTAHERAEQYQQRAAGLAAGLEADAEAIEDATRRAGRAGQQSFERSPNASREDNAAPAPSEHNPTPRSTG